MKEFVKRIIQFVDKFSTRLQFGNRKEEKGVHVQEASLERVEKNLLHLHD